MVLSDKKEYPYLVYISPTR